MTNRRDPNLSTSTLGVNEVIFIIPASHYILDLSPQKYSVDMKKQRIFLNLSNIPYKLHVLSGLC